MEVKKYRLRAWLEGLRGHYVAPHLIKAIGLDPQMEGTEEELTAALKEAAQEHHRLFKTILYDVVKILRIELPEEKPKKKETKGEEEKQAPTQEETKEEKPKKEKTSTKKPAKKPTPKEEKPKKGGKK